MDVLFQTNCDFNPKRPCGSAVRQRNAYDRPTLIKHATKCQIISPHLYTMDTLCSVLRERYYMSQKESTILADFYRERGTLPTSAKTFGSLSGSNLQNYELYKIFPTPTGFVFMTMSGLEATPQRVAAVWKCMAAKTAVREYLTTLMMRQLPTDATDCAFLMTMYINVSLYKPPEWQNACVRYLKQIENQTCGAPITAKQIKNFVKIFRKKVLAAMTITARRSGKRLMTTTPSVLSLPTHKQTEDLEPDRPGTPWEDFTEQSVPNPFE
jgi:hypothetical protein